MFNWLFELALPTFVFVRNLENGTVHTSHYKTIPSPSFTKGNDNAWVIGVFACIAGSFCGSLGDNMVRKGFMIAGEDVKVYEMWRSPLWAVGMFMNVVVNTSCTLVALSFAPATVVTSFAGVHIFWNMVFAKTWNREKTVWWDYIGSYCIIVGIVFIVVFSGKQQHIFTVNQFIANLDTVSSVFFVGCILIVITSGFLLSYDRLAHQLLGDKYANVFQRFFIASSAGFCGGLSNVLAKVIMLIVSTIEYIGVEGVCSNWRVYFVFIFTIALALTQLFFLNVALQRFEAIFVVPTINAFLIASGSMGGLILFEEYPTNMHGFFFGLTLAIGGVVSLSYGKFEAEILAIEQFGEMDDGQHSGISWEGGLPSDEEEVVPTCFDHVCKPLTDASVDILARTNTFSVRYPTRAMSRTFESRASIRALQKRLRNGGGEDSFEDEEMSEIEKNSFLSPVTEKFERAYSDNHSLPDRSTHDVIDFGNLSHIMDGKNNTTFTGLIRETV